MSSLDWAKPDVETGFDIGATITGVAYSLGRYRQHVQGRVGGREQLRKTRATEQAALDAAEISARCNADGQVFLQSVITEQREAAVTLIAEMASAALQRVYGDGYCIRFVSNESKRIEGKASTFTMEIKLVSTFQGQELITGFIGQTGGGAMEAAAFALRLAFLTVVGWDGPILIDEGWSAMSTDGKLTSVAEFLVEAFDLTGRQCILVTHAGVTFGPIANQLILVEKGQDGVGRARQIGMSEIPKASN